MVLETKLNEGVTTVLVDSQSLLKDYDIHLWKDVGTFFLYKSVLCVLFIAMILILHVQCNINMWI